MNGATDKKEFQARWKKYQEEPKFRHITRELDGTLERESYVYSTPDGAIELWRRGGDSKWSNSGYFGGVEVHSPQPLYDGQEQMPGHCEHVWGGKCWTGGSSMAFEEFDDCFNLPDYIETSLAQRHEQTFSEPGQEDDEPTDAGLGGAVTDPYDAHSYQGLTK